MKQFSIILILLSCVLGIISRTINLIDFYFVDLDVFSTFSSLYTRFGDLTVIAGFLGVFLIVKNNMKLKTLALAIVLSGFFHFLIIEYGFISEYGVLSALILLVRFAVLILFVIQYKDEEMDALRVKGFVCISTIGIYWLAFFIISLIPVCVTCSTPHASLTILPFFYIIFQLGLWMFILELYREIFNYKNEHYINL